MTPTSPPSLTIGVFDSGFGGLTVLRALLPLIPGAHFIYLGDTARLPYGSKSRETIARYAVSSAKFLHDQGADLLVVACNTATALALDDIQQALPIPVIGVVQPGAHAAARAAQQMATLDPSLDPAQSPAVDPALNVDLNLALQPDLDPALHPALNPAQAPTLPTTPPPAPSHAAPPSAPPSNHVLVLATAATVQSHAYTHALNAVKLEAFEKACPLLVPLVEEGWTNHPVTDEVLKIYLNEALTAAPATSTLLLGCTHYPLLEPAIRRTLEAIGHPLTLIDSADATAQATASLVAEKFPGRTSTGEPTCTFYATDSVEKFQRLGSTFLGHPVPEVNLIDLGG